MTALLVLAGIALVAAGIVLRELPRVVTGISMFSVMQFAGLVLLVYAFVRRRHAFAEHVRSTDTGKYLRIILILAWVLPALQLTGAVSSEIEEGRHFDKVSALLRSTDPMTARTLSGFLPAKITVSAPLRKQILAQIAKLGNRDSEVTGPILTSVREDPDREVRGKAGEALGKLMTPSDVYRILIYIDRRDPETRTLLVQALTASTGQAFGPDTAAWRRWFGETFAGAPSEEAWRLANLAYGDHGGDEALRDLAFQRIAEGAGSTVAEIEVLADDRESPALRVEGARLLAARGERKHAKFLGLLLKKEPDEAAAAAQVAAIQELSPAGADAIFFGIADRASVPAGRAAARAALLNGEEIDEEDPTALTAFVFRKQKDRKRRNELLTDLIRLADDGAAARVELLRLATSEEEPDWLRGRALKAVLGADPASISNGALIDLLEKKGGREFREGVRSELKRRTGKDFGLDAKAWRGVTGSDGRKKNR